MLLILQKSILSKIWNMAVPLLDILFVCLSRFGRLPRHAVVFLDKRSHLTWTGTSAIIASWLYPSLIDPCALHLTRLVKDTVYQWRLRELVHENTNMGFEKKSRVVSIETQYVFTQGWTKTPCPRSNGLYIKSWDMVTDLWSSCHYSLASSTFNL